MLGELRLLGATEVHTPKRFDPVNPCHALYALWSYPQTYCRTTDSVDGARGTTETVGQKWDSCMRFTLTGERVDDLTMPRNGRVYALLTKINADVRRRKGTARP